jgi:hypothetical protein
MRSAAPVIQGGGQADQGAACLYIEFILPRLGDFVTRRAKRVVGDSCVQAGLLKTERQYFVRGL